jgi:hypothetical protein
LRETKAAGKRVEIHWIPTHRCITGDEKADKLAKHSIRQGRGSQIPIPAEDMKSLWRKKFKEGSQLWDGSWDSNTPHCSLIESPIPDLTNVN